MIVSTWPWLVILAAGLLLFIVVGSFVTPRESKKLRDTRLWGGLNALVWDQFGVAHLVHGKSFIDGRFFLTDDNELYVGSAKMECPDDHPELKADFETYNRVLQNPVILNGTGKPLFIGSKAHGVILPAGVLDLFSKSIQRSKLRKATIRDAVGGKDAAASGVKATPVDTISIEAINVIMTRTLSTTQLNLLRGYYEAQGAGFNKKKGFPWIILIIGAGLLVLFIVAAPYLSKLGK